MRVSRSTITTTTEWHYGFPWREDRLMTTGIWKILVLPWASRIREIHRAALLVITCLLATCMAQTAHADSVTYTYTGNNFLNVFLGAGGNDVPVSAGYYGTYSCPPECSITGSFTVAQALPSGVLMSVGAVPPSQQLVLASFRFTDGNTVWNNANSTASEFTFETTSMGGVAQWVISLSQDSGSLHYALFTTACFLPSSTSCALPDNPPEDDTYLTNSTPNNPNPESFAANFFSPGAWTVTQTISPPTPIPEPSSLILLGSGLLTLAAALRARGTTTRRKS